MASSPGRTKTLLHSSGSTSSGHSSASSRRSNARAEKLARSNSVLVSGSSSAEQLHAPHQQSHGSRLSGLLSGTVRAVSQHKSKRSSSAPIDLNLPESGEDPAAASTKLASRPEHDVAAGDSDGGDARSHNDGDDDNDPLEGRSLPWHLVPPVLGPFTALPGVETTDGVVPRTLADLLHHAAPEPTRSGSGSAADARIEDMPAMPQAFALLQGPLLSPDLFMQMYPHVIDAVVGSLPPDAWDWVSTEAELSRTSHDELTTEIKIAVEEVKPTIESVLTKDKRGHVVLNLWETEQNYVAQLGVIQKVFRQRLTDREIITETASAFIFAGTEELYAFHLKFLDALERVVGVDNWSTTESRIGSLFLQQKDEFVRIYTRFIDNYAISHKSMKKEEKTNEEYQSFMKEMIKLRETNRQTLKEFLILPVQRTTRYHLFLKDLVKNTPDDHPDKKDLETAWEEMNKLAAMVNEKKRREEEATGLFDTFEMTKHCPPTLISHKRRLIMRSDAVVERNSRKEVQLILCSDLLMVNVPTRYGGVLGFSRASSEYPYRFVRWLDLLELDVFDMAAEEGIKDCIKITIDSFKRPPSRPSQTTSVQDTSQSSLSKELAGNTVSFVFVGVESTKNFKNFKLAIQAEMKSCRDAASQAT